MMISRPSTSRTMVAETPTTTSSITINDGSHAQLLYNLNSEECYRNRDHQHQCMEELYGRIFSENGSPPNDEELLRLLEALTMQLPDFQPPLPTYMTPIIRFDVEKVPYFEFHCFSSYLPMIPPLTGITLVTGVDDFICAYSKAIFQCMMEANSRFQITFQ